jgi:hypothetical protein
LTRVGKNLQRLAVSYAVPEGSREVTVAFNFISERTVLNVSDIYWEYLNGCRPISRQQRNANISISVSRAEFKPVNAVFKLPKSGRILDRTASVIAYKF